MLHYIDMLNNAIAKAIVKNDTSKYQVIIKGNQNISTNETRNKTKILLHINFHL